MADYLSNQGAGRPGPFWPILLCLAAALLLSLGAAKAKAPPAYSPDDYSLIRVVLSDSKTVLEVGGALSWEVKGKDIGDSTAVATIKLIDSATVKLVLGKKGWSAGRVIATPKKGFVRFNGREYRGRIEFYPSRDGDTLVALNVLPLEDYLLGVVPSEMPAAWPADALRAQAVAARSYAAFSMRAKRVPGRDGKLPSFDVYPDQSDQVYKGVSGEDPRTSQAVRDTAGQMLTWQGKPIFAQFCADCGGSTKCGSQPYLQSVPCFAPDSPHNEWCVKLSADKLSSLAGGGIGKVREVRAENDKASGHLLKLNIVGDSGSKSIGGNSLREMLGLSTMKSTRAYITAPGGSTLEQQETQFSMAPVAKPAVVRQPLDATDVFTMDADGDGFIPDEQATAPDGSEVMVAAREEEPQLNTRKRGERMPALALDLPRLFELEDFARPTVLYGEGVADLKLRNAYIFDGVKLRKPPGVAAVLGTEPGLETAELDIDIEAEEPQAQQSDDAAARESRQEQAARQQPKPAATTGASGRQPKADPIPAKPRFELDKQMQSEIPASSKVKVGSGGIELRGSGYGHGVGLSQWGARELANQGLDYLSILLHFYTGVEVQTFAYATETQTPSKKQKGKAASAETKESEKDNEAVDVFYKPFQR